jgi:hypothetical protein
MNAKPIENQGYFRLLGISACSVESLPRLNSSIATVLPREGEIAVFDNTPKARNEVEMWTEARNQRRCELINRKYSGGITPLEASELATLQEQMLRHSQNVAPLPIENARHLYQELLAETNGSPLPTTS